MRALLALRDTTSGRASKSPACSTAACRLGGGPLAGATTTRLTALASTAKQQLTYGTGADRLTDAQAVLRLKKWLVDGYDVSQDGEFSRKLHVRMYNARKGADPSEAELEAWTRPDSGAAGGSAG